MPKKDVLHAPFPDSPTLSIQRLKAKRLLQIISLTFFGLLFAVAVARGTTQFILLAGCSSLAIAGWCAYQKKIDLASSLLLWSMALMLSALAYVSGGIRDLALLGYPGVLIFAVILGNSRLFFTLFASMVLFCGLLTTMTLSGDLTPQIPAVTAAHFIFVSVILLVTGSSVYLLYRDHRRLLVSLEQENQRVRQSEATIARLAHHDPLTDLPNRILCQQLFQQLYQQCLEGDQQLALLFLDLDNFKPVNDSLGHAAGDLLLKQLALRLSSLLGPDDVLCRFGGDEFLLLHPGTGEHSTLALLAQQILDQTTAPFFIMQTQIEISGSVGLAIAPKDGSSFSQLCKHADMAMYQAKADGRNVFRFFHDDLNKASIDKFNLLQRMRQALKDGEFNLHYQPIIDLKTGQAKGAEALLRWPQSDGSYLAPDQFIPLAESSGFIQELGQWVLQQACLACGRWQQQGYSQLNVAVNLSYVQFRSGQLEASVQQALNTAGIAPQLLELELTESLLIGEGDSIQRQLNSFSELGVSFSIDDFGTGYSNLGYLRRFNASRLKIDKSFILSLCLSERDEPLVRAIIQLSKSLGLKTVAEGIEDLATLQRLTLLGCDEGQGFYFAKALPEADLLGFVSSLELAKVEA